MIFSGGSGKDPTTDLSVVELGLDYKSREITSDMNSVPARDSSLMGTHGYQPHNDERLVAVDADVGDRGEEVDDDPSEIPGLIRRLNRALARLSYGQMPLEPESDLPPEYQAS